MAHHRSVRLRTWVGSWLARTVDRYRSGEFATTALTWHDVDVRDYGSSVVTIGTQSQQAAYKGMPSNGDFRITHVFVRDRGRWKIAGMQLSPTTFTPPTPAVAR